MPDTGATLPFIPKRVFLTCSWYHDWLFPPIMSIMRARFGTSFLLLLAHDRIEDFAPACEGLDKIVTPAEFGPPQQSDTTLDADEVFARARQLEQQHNIKYMLDIIQQDRVLSATFLKYAAGSALSLGKPPELLQITDYINRCFDYFSDFLEREKFDLIVERPGGIAPTVMIHTALARGIPVTMLAGSYYKAFGMWSNSPYLGPDFIRPIFENTPPAQPTPIDELKPHAEWRPKPPPKIRQLARALAVEVAVYGIKAWQDLKARKRHKRLPFKASVYHEIMKFRMARHLDAISIKDIDTIARRPFLYFALPSEPEYTIQSVCREMADLRAILRQLALAMPAGATLVLKEHQQIGNRGREFYDYFNAFPNVVFADPALRGVDLIARCDAAATMSGTTGLEAAMFGKRAIVFTHRVPYGFLPHAMIVENIRDLPAITTAAMRQPTPEEAMDFRCQAARFNNAVASVAIDLTGTAWFRGGTKMTLPPQDYERAVDLLIAIATSQRDRLAQGRLATVI